MIERDTRERQGGRERGRERERVGVRGEQVGVREGKRVRERGEKGVT